MKTGKTLSELAMELTRINDKKKDFIVPVSKMKMEEEKIRIDGMMALPLNNWSHGQLATYTDIPKAYYDRIKQESPTLLADNVNHALSKSPQDKRLVRVLDGNIRALLSNRYRMLDSYDLAETVLPIMLRNEMKVISSDITEKNLYIRAVMPKLEGEIKKGDAVQYGIQISSSDVGAGSLRVEPLIYRLVCTNGLITSQAMRKYHIGKSTNEFDDIREILSDRAKELSDQAFWQSVHDVVCNSLKPEIFQAQIELLKEASEQKITNYNLDQVIDITCKSMNFSASKDLKNNLLAQLANGNEGAGLTKWGLANTFTALASHNDGINFDDSVELERIGGKIISLSESEWRKIAA